MNAFMKRRVGPLEALALGGPHKIQKMYENVGWALEGACAGRA
jgi:hypothetical protein